MHTIEQRAEARRKKITLKKLNLHSSEHNSFHPTLSVAKAWELLTRLSQESWIEKTGQFPPSRVDKSIYKFITISSKI